MSNYDLQSKLNQLQGELRQAERVNAELRGELSTVEQGVNRAHRDLEDYNDKIRGTLDNCNGTMTSSHQRVIDARARLKECMSASSKWSWPTKRSVLQTTKSIMTLQTTGL